MQVIILKLIRKVIIDRPCLISGLITFFRPVDMPLYFRQIPISHVSLSLLKFPLSKSFEIYTQDQVS
jgi:hypothetical protein